MNDVKPIIRVQHLTAKYGEKAILNDISFDVFPREIFVILGGSGIGKTTLFRHLIGLQDPVAGNIYIDDQELVHASEKERLAILRKMGVMYQSGALFGSLNLIENVRLPLQELTELPTEAIDWIAEEKLKMVGLSGFERYKPAELSGGMQKRAALARAMALDPKILFLDEPSSGLDPVTSAQLDQLILNLSKTLGITFVIVSHELPSIYAIASRAIMLGEGKIIAMGHPNKLRTECDNPAVKKFFNREA